MPNPFHRGYLLEKACSAGDFDFRERPLFQGMTGCNGHERDDRLLIEADVEIAFGSGDRAGLHSGQFRDDGRICVGDACPF